MMCEQERGLSNPAIVTKQENWEFLTPQLWFAQPLRRCEDVLICLSPSWLHTPTSMELTEGRSWWTVGHFSLEIPESVGPLQCQGSQLQALGTGRLPQLHPLWLGGQVQWLTRLLNTQWEQMNKGGATHTHRGVTVKGGGVHVFGYAQQIWRVAAHLSHLCSFSVLLSSCSPHPLSPLCWSISAWEQVMQIHFILNTHLHTHTHTHTWMNPFKHT